jgi:hypothetical protein
MTKSGTEPSSDDKADVETELETGRSVVTLDVEVGLEGDENGFLVVLVVEGVSVLVG